MAITAQELGRLVGCSTATISRALNNTGKVAPETREAIYRTLRQTSYVPQRAARRTRRGQTDPAKLVHIIYHRHSPRESLSLGQGGLTVGPLNPVSEASLRDKSPVGDNFWRGIIDGAVAELSAWGYKPVLQTNTNLESSEFLAELNAPDKAAVLLLGEPSDGLKSVVEMCRHPLVLADLDCPGPHDAVTIDNPSGISAAFDHLHGLGHRKFGFAGRHDSNFAHAERFAAFKMKMADANLPLRYDWIYEGYSHIEEAVAGVKKLLSQSDRPTALLCANDCIAMGAIRAASALGIRLPDQLSIVGFDDIDAAVLVTPALTTVHVSVQDLGRQAIRLLMVQAKSGAHHAQCRVRLVPQLVIRESTTRAPDTAPAETGVSSITSRSS